jgi:outer membrane protein TolC
VPPRDRPEFSATPPGPSPAEIVPEDLATRIRALTLTDVVDLSLRNNPATQQTWANARAAAAAYGSARGTFLPSLDADLQGARIRTTATQGRSATEQTVYEPMLSVSWLIWDFSRNGVNDQARNALLAADWTHNATVQDVILTSQLSFFLYMGTRSLLAADRASVEQARASLEAAEHRHAVGVATIADVLQAQTALSQAELRVITSEGGLATARGTLAVAMGLPANLPYDVDSLEGQPPIAELADSVDSLIASAVRDRPDLAAAQAVVQQADARVTETRGARLPSLRLSGQGGWTGVVGQEPLRSNYTLMLGLHIPLFNGFSREYDQRAAQADADAARAGAQGLRQQVVLQVFTSYYALQTATRRVRTTDDLMASAERSAEVALGRYREGVGSVIDLLTAEAALADARAQQVEAHWGWQAALARLSHDTGLLDPLGRSGIRLEPDSAGAESGQ